MNTELHEKSLISWAQFISDSQFNSTEQIDLEDKLKENFSKEYERIRSIYSSIDYFEDKELLINSFVMSIPEKLEKLQLLIRPFKDKFYSCIITDEEIELLSGLEHIRWENFFYENGWQFGEIKDLEAKIHPELISFTNLPVKRQKFYREIIYTIPVILHLSGYEIFKPFDQEFIKDNLLEGIARAIHERFRILMRDMNEKSLTDSVYERLYIVNEFNRQYYLNDYDHLPEDVKSSNLDSAHHISTKLLSIGYAIKDTESLTNQAILFLNDNDIETMAKLEHERWAWEKRLKGFTYSEIRNDSLKKHPCLVPYSELPELEKVKDRELVKFIPDLLDDINYSVVPLSPEQIQHISYIPQKRILLQESIEYIEKSILEINEKDYNTEEEKKFNISSQLVESLKNIRSTKDELFAASQIQNCILPTKLFFRQCLPESFVLYKPKDILSGDFYFVSKIHNFIIMAAADCTGHGTAGAMLSMICSNIIDQAVNDNKLTDPSMIISFVYEKLLGFMKRQDSSVISDFGMEIAICTIILDSRTVFYAGINRPLYLFRDGKLVILEAQKLKSGSGYESLVGNVKHSQMVNLKKGETFYAFSDGYVDQFGGKENRKFLTKNFQNLLENIQPKTMIEQYEILDKTIEQWKGTGKEDAVEQTDDILVIGVKV